MKSAAPTSTREEIVHAADRLFYERGFEHTSFADIAARVGISRGNFYHHFKSKDEILDAVIVARLVGTEAMLARWEHARDTPEGRVRCFIDMIVAHRSDIERYGCPVGTLCTELAKLGHPARAEANALFTLFRTWLRAQLEAAGGVEDADGIAMHLLARSQGIAVLASAFRDGSFIHREVALLHAWLDARLAERASSGRRARRRGA